MLQDQGIACSGLRKSIYGLSIYISYRIGEIGGGYLDVGASSKVAKILQGQMKMPFFTPKSLSFLLRPLMRGTVELIWTIGLAGKGGLTRCGSAARRDGKG